MKIGNLEIRGDLVLAPMAGVTDLAFRTICAELGAAVTVTEMVSSRALIYQDKKSRSLLHRTPIGVCGAQIFGNDPSVMAEGAALALEASGADFIDINMGCPMPKIVNNGDGSALMKDPEKAARIVEAVCGAVDVPVTVKMRKGWDKGSCNAPVLAAMLEQAGAAAIAVHGRTKTMLYSGLADWDSIRAVREAVRIPVQHFHVSQQVMAHGDGLGALQVSIARHHGICVFLRLHDQRALQMAHFSQNFIDFRPAVKPRVRSYLVIAGACGMQLGARSADAPGEFAFNVHVHVLQFPAPREVACFNVFQDVFQAGFNGVEFFLRKQASLELGPRMGDGSGNVLAEKPPVVGDGFAVALNQISGGFRKSAFPHDPHVVPQELPF